MTRDRITAILTPDLALCRVHYTCHVCGEQWGSDVEGQTSCPTPERHQARRKLTFMAQQARRLAEGAERYQETVALLPYRGA